MSKYFNFTSQELLIELNKVRHFIKRHNPTIGVLTEEVLRSFLKKHLPSLVTVSQGFVQSIDGKISKQCDIIIYDSLAYAPVYQAGNIAIIPSDAVIALIEVKTKIDSTTFHEVINYFKSFDFMPNASTHLFIFEGKSIRQISRYFANYKHPGDYQNFDHDTFQYLPDTITALSDPYHLKKDAIISDCDEIGYSSWYYKDAQGSEINALQTFYESIADHVSYYIDALYRKKQQQRPLVVDKRTLKSISAIPLYNM
jgi:hypothetical protein